ncbi:MAG: hypothetical protein HKP27_15815, partial [Myxococcales bacterium]|nr:hypothetical protein [Myxococcales bacterium]
LVEIDWNPDLRTLRQFGAIALVGFSLLAVAAWFGFLVFSMVPVGARETTAAGLAALGALCGVFGLIWPAGNRPIFVGLSLLAAPIGFVLSYLILGVLFYIIISGVSLLLRALGKDPLERAIQPEASTYWVEAKPARPAASYFKQF